MLLRKAAPDADHELLGQALIGFLDTALIHHLTQQRHIPLSRVEDAWCDLVRRTVSGRPQDD
jgi:hypothetical protein